VLANYNIKLSNILYHWLLSIASFGFCETYLLHIKPFVVNKSVISPFLGSSFMCVFLFYRPCYLCMYFDSEEICQMIYYTIHMGRLRSVGSFKLQVSFAEYRLFYRTLLQKRPIILRNLLIVATPYMYFDLTEMVIHLCIFTAKNIDLSNYSCVYFDLTEIVICMCIVTLQKHVTLFGRCVI